MRVLKLACKVGANSNTTFVKVKLPYDLHHLAFAEIQIQHLLKLNCIFILFIELLCIQIQHLLKLNY